MSSWKPVFYWRVLNISWFLNDLCLCVLILSHPHVSPPHTAPYVSALHTPSLKCDSHMVAVWFHHVMNFVMINRNKKVAKRCSREVPWCTKQRWLPNRHISRFNSALHPYTTFISPSANFKVNIQDKSTLFPPAVFYLLIYKMWII